MTDNNKYIDFHINIANMLLESAGMNNSEMRQGITETRNAKDKLTKNISNAINSKNKIKSEKLELAKELDRLVRDAINNSKDRDRIYELKSKMRSLNTSSGNYTRSIKSNIEKGKTINNTSKELTYAKRTANVNNVINANDKKEIVKNLYNPKNARRGELLK